MLSFKTDGWLSKVKQKANNIVTNEKLSAGIWSK